MSPKSFNFFIFLISLKIPKLSHFHILAPLAPSLLLHILPPHLSLSPIHSKTKTTEAKSKLFFVLSKAMRELERLKTSPNHPWPPIGAPMNLRREEPWKSGFDDSVNAVSFGFVATAILISMFLVMAIFEKLIRTTTSTTNPDSSSGRVLPGMDSRVGLHGAAAKLGYQSPKASNLLFFP